MEGLAAFRPHVGLQEMVFFLDAEVLSCRYIKMGETYTMVSIMLGNQGKKRQILDEDITSARFVGEASKQYCGWHIYKFGGFIFCMSELQFKKRKKISWI